MSATMKMVVALAGLSAAQGLTVTSWNPLYVVSGDNIHSNDRVDSKPGTPKIHDWEGTPVLLDTQSWRVALGERLLKAANAHDAMKKCGSFLSFGDYSWCTKAMPKEVAKFRENYRGISKFVVSNDSTISSAKPDGMLGLSFGIRTSDAWSELMSSMFLVKTQLFDCYFDGNEGPMANDMHKGYSKSKPCMQRGCYTVDYECNKVCNDDTTANKESFNASNGRTYEPLSALLKGRPELSTFIKMDVEGSEWATLDRLLKNEKDMEKIRTLDMEVHFNLDATPQGNRPITQTTLTRHVELMEKLATKFAVTGSSLETYVEKVIASYKEKRKLHPKWIENSTAQVYTKGGIILNQYTISFVNRRLL